MGAEWSIPRGAFLIEKAEKNWYKEKRIMILNSLKKVR